MHKDLMLLKEAHKYLRHTGYPVVEGLEARIKEIEMETKKPMSEGDAQNLANVFFPEPPAWTYDLIRAVEKFHGITN
jgi:hypothetical protein